MSLVERVAIRLSEDGEAAFGTLTISTLPNSPSSLWDFRSNSEVDASVEPVQVLESHEYRFEFTLFESKGQTVSADRSELFLPDKHDGLTGRFRPGLNTGTLPVTMRTSGGNVATFKIEVRSKKVDYLRDYRWMLRDIATLGAEVVMRSFAPSEQRFAPDGERDAATLYQRFAFVKSILADESFDSALHRILARPHIAWKAESEARRPGQGWKNGSSSILSFSRGGRREYSEAVEGPLAEFGIPEFLDVLQTEPTLDNTPNRFVKFALLQWEELAQSMITILGQTPGAPADRGRREAEDIASKLRNILAAELFGDVGQLNQIPLNDQVIQRREGYRDIYHLYLLSDVAAQLSWSGGELIYGAGQKDIATLYEYWAFLQLANVVEAVCGDDFDWQPLLQRTADGSNLNFLRGRASRLTGSATRLGRTLSIELWFNRTFGMRGHEGARSWSRSMRPDCSLLISPVDVGDESVEPVWLHFDAKYRVDNLREIMPEAAFIVREESSDTEAEETPAIHGTSKSDDLTKMHAYKDAISRSAGAYVLYPGDGETVSREYHEILPGLGAFALKPDESGTATGAAALQGFVGSVIDHVALQISQHERARYWTQRSFLSKPTLGTARAVAFLPRPAADTRVLLAFVKGREHLNWIRTSLRYNLRADDRTGSVGLTSDALSVDLVLLYGPTLDRLQLWRVGGAPELATVAKMRDLGYPNPRGSIYFCLVLQEEITDSWPDPLTPHRLSLLRRAIAPEAVMGAPITVTWKQLVTS